VKQTFIGEAGRAGLLTRLPEAWHSGETAVKQQQTGLEDYVVSGVFAVSAVNQR